MCYDITTDFYDDHEILALPRLDRDRLSSWTVLACVQAKTGDRRVSTGKRPARHALLMSREI